MEIKKENLSALEAFIALEDYDDEEDYRPITEGKSFPIRDEKAMQDADQARQADKKSENVTLEVIDADADTLDHMKDPSEYVGQMLLQCNTCKATKFVDTDKLVKSEADDQVYNVEDECPHCHSTGKGYSLIGQVGKAPEEEKPEETPEDEEDKDSEEEASFTNDDEKEEPKEDEGSDEADSEDKKDSDEGEPEETFAWDETPDDDDTKDMEDTTGEEVDDDDVKKDDTEDDDEDDKKKKDESITEDGEEELSAKEVLRNKLKRARGLKESLEDDNNPVPGQTDLKLDAEAKKEVKDVEKQEVEQPAEEPIKEEITVNEDQVQEELDLNSWEGSVDSLLARFTVEDSRLGVKFFDTNGEQIAAYDDTDDIPFEYDTAFVNEFNADDDYIELSVSEPTEEDDEDVCSVATLFDKYKDQEGTSFVVTNNDTDEEEDVETVDELIEKYGAMNIDGAVSVKSLNLYIDKEGTTEEKPEKEESIEEVLTRDILRVNGLKESKISDPNSTEYFISESMRRHEDLDKVYEQFVKGTEMENPFKNTIGYKDDIDIFLESHGIDRRVFEAAKAKSEEKLCEKCGKPISECICGKETVNEEFWKSARDRKALTYYINLLKENKLDYLVKRSLNEDYRYDIFLKGKINEAKFNFPSTDVHPRTQVMDQQDHSVPSTEVRTPETGIVPEGMSDEEVETITKINEKARLIQHCIEETYGVHISASDIAADMIRDLQLVGGAINPEQLANTPEDQLTAEMYREFEESQDFLDALIGVVTGQEVHSSREDRLARAIDTLDRRNFSPENIQRGIESDQFLIPAIQGQVPYIDAREIALANPDRVAALPGGRRILQQLEGSQRERQPELVDVPRRRNEELDTNNKGLTEDQRILDPSDYRPGDESDPRSPWYDGGHEIGQNTQEAYKALKNAILTEYPDSDIEEMKDDQERGVVSCEFNLYVPREGATEDDPDYYTEDSEEIESAFERLFKKYNLRKYGLTIDDFTLKNDGYFKVVLENYSFDEDKFDECVNKYFSESYEDPMFYHSISAKKLDEGYEIQGIIDAEDKSLPITWNLKNLNENYEVTNSLSEEKLTYNLNKNLNNDNN